MHNPTYIPLVFSQDCPNPLKLHTFSLSLCLNVFKFTDTHISLSHTVHSREIWGMCVGNPSGKIPVANPPPFSNIGPRYMQGGAYHLLGRAWASPTLVDCNAKRVCMYVCMYVCAWPYTDNLNWANGFQICSRAKTSSCAMNSTPMKVQLRTLTDKGRLLTDGTVKTCTVVAFASGKGHTNDSHKRQRFSSWLHCEV